MNGLYHWLRKITYNSRKKTKKKSRHDAHWNEPKTKRKNHIKMQRNDVEPNEK